MLEALVHPGASFITLTYDDKFLPDGGSLEPRDLELFIKRLRFALDPVRIRHFSVGEYGDDTERPHYHMALFGVDRSCLPTVRQCWGMGHCSAYDLDLGLAQYLCGYVVKKMTDKDDDRLSGRYPEFARMSNRPGIGAVAISQIAVALRAAGDKWDHLQGGDVPTVLKHGRKGFPLGRYMRDKLREELGIEKNEQITEASAAELLALYESAFLAENNTLSLRDFAEGHWKQKVKQMEKRHLIKNRGKI